MIKIKKLLLQQINNSILNDNNNNNKLKEKINKMNRKIIILKKINPKFNRLSNFFKNNENKNINHSNNDSFDINISYIGDVDNKFGIYKDTLKNYLNKKNIKKNLSLMENKFIKKLCYEEKYFENKNEIQFPKKNLFFVKNYNNFIRNNLNKNSKNKNVLIKDKNNKNKEINKFLEIKKISLNDLNNLNVFNKRNFVLKDKNYSFDFINNINNNRNNINEIEDKNSYYI